MSAREALLPVHGFVLAGGKSSRMGVDKAMLEFRGRPMVEIAVEKLRGFCANVSICGNRDDLSGFAPVVREARVDAGPAAGIEAGLMAARQEWCLFVPVDVPLVPGKLLRRWAEAVLEKGAAGCGVSFLVVNGQRQPSLSMVKRDGAGIISDVLDRGERKLENLFYRVDDADVGWLWVCDALRAVPGAKESWRMGYWFSNLNTAQDFDEAELWAEGLGE